MGRDVAQVIANRPAAEKRKLFHDNAVKVYGLEQEEG